MCQVDIISIGDVYNETMKVGMKGFEMMEFLPINYEVRKIENDEWLPWVDLHLHHLLSDELSQSKGHQFRRKST